jgi:molybdenum cofactor cytidylyltransferase
MKRVDGIVLAAGASRRMGEGKQKLLMEIHEVPMIQRVVASATHSQLHTIHVVTGAEHKQIVTLLPGSSRIHCTRNPRPEHGMLSSVRCGLHALSPSCDGVAVMLGDQPMIDASTIDQVIDAWRSSKASIALPIYDNQRGHPLIFDRRYVDEILSDFDDQGLRGLAQRYPGEVELVTVATPSILHDIDTPEDYEKFQHARAAERSTHSSKLSHGGNHRC